MTVRDDDLSDPSGDRPAFALRKIAEALGTSTEAFLQPHASTSDTGTLQELLRLWSELPDSQARQRILAQLRREVERHSQRSEAAG